MPCHGKAAYEEKEARNDADSIYGCMNYPFASVFPFWNSFVPFSVDCVMYCEQDNEQYSCPFMICFSYEKIEHLEHKKNTHSDVQD